MHLRCRACSAHFCLAEYQGQMDEHFDEELADTRCDRL
ncbi:MAG TPA: dual CXXC motif small (seleno)protein [Desulfobacterales bacterium]|nr:dual CXXC motif small (seleno)protein [Desulfobacterales bacterium]